MLPKTCPKPLTGAEISSRLDDLFKNWNGADYAYGYFLLSLPARLDVEADAAQTLAQQPHGTLVNLKYYQLNDANVSVTAVMPPALDGQGVFAGAQANDQIFVVLPTLGVTVPVKVAGMLSQQFTAGFVTRLVLEAQNQSLVTRKLTGTVPNAIPLPKLDITASIAPDALQGFATKSTYDNCKTPPFPPANTTQTACASIDDVITNQFVNASPEMIGITLGWRAASELIATDKTVNHDYIRDAWQLIHSRYSTRSIGRLVGFTLNYMTGYAMNSRIQNGATAASVGYDNNALILKVENDPSVQANKQFLRDIYTVWLTEFYAISQTSMTKKPAGWPASKNPPNWQKADDYYNMLVGFQQGVNNAFGLIYKEESNIEWSAGYSRGYKDGYSAGYAAGYYDGFAAGNAAAWAQATLIIAGLQAQITSLQGQLASAQSGGSGSCSGFWNSITCAANAVGGIIGPASTIIGTISSFF